MWLCCEIHYLAFGGEDVKAGVDFGGGGADTLIGARGLPNEASCRAAGVCSNKRQVQGDYRVRWCRLMQWPY